MAMWVYCRKTAKVRVSRFGNAMDILWPVQSGWAKKRGHRLTTIILSNLNRCKILFTGIFRGKFAVKWILKVASHLAYVATPPPGETLMLAEQAINDKLQGSVATYFRFGEVFNNRIRKRFIAECMSEFFLKSVNIWRSCKQERGCLMHFARLVNTLLKDEESARDKYSPTLKLFFTLRLYIGISCSCNWRQRRL